MTADILPFRSKHMNNRIAAKIISKEADELLSKAIQVAEREDKTPERVVEEALEGMDDTTRTVLTPALAQMFDIQEWNKL